MRQIIVIATLLAIGGSTAAAARDPEPAQTPAIVQRLLACRAMTDTTQRLACYDRETGMVADAIAKRDVVVIDKVRATAAKRSLFGFSVPDFAGLFGGGDLNEIEGTVASASQDAFGGWVIKLTDGSAWNQTEEKRLALEPRRGDKITVKRGALGSYFLKVGNQPGFKAKRIN
jgi:hypothetical protein